MDTGKDTFEEVHDTVIAAEREPGDDPGRGTRYMFGAAAIFGIALGAFLVSYFVLYGPLDPAAHVAGGVNGPATQQEAAVPPPPPPPPANPS